MSLTTKVTDIEQLLNSWHRLDKLKRTQETTIQKLEERVRHIKEMLSDDAIRSGISQKYGIDMVMPRGSNVSDRVGNLVSSVDEKLTHLRLQLADAYTEYAETCHKLWNIEQMTAGLSDRHKRVLEMMYRDKAHHSSISGKLYISKARVYDMRDEAVAEIRRWA